MSGQTRGRSVSAARDKRATPNCRGQSLAIQITLTVAISPSPNKLDNLAIIRWLASCLPRERTARTNCSQMCSSEAQDTGGVRRDSVMMILLLLVAVSATQVTAEEEIMKNLTTVTWAHAVNNKTYLEAALASDVSMLEADIVLGHITGKEGPLIPIMAHPPATTSDLTLGDFLTAVSQYNNGNSKQKGVKLDFKSIEAFEKSQDQIAQFSKPEITFPLWLNADILPGPVNATTTPVDPVRFLELGAKHPRAVLSVGWTTNYGSGVAEGEYSRNQIGTMLRLVNDHVNQTVTFPVRAGLASNSQPVILDLLRETASLNSSMTVWSSEGDPVEVDRLRALILTVGLERTYLDVPHELAAKLHLPPADSKLKN